MTAKGRRHRGRYSAPDKKKKGRRRPDTVAPRPVAVSQTATVAALPPKVAPQTREIAKKSTVVVTGHLDIMAELRRVGILAVIMLAILVILALVLA